MADEDVSLVVLLRRADKLYFSINNNPPADRKQAQAQGTHARYRHDNQ